MCFLAFFGPLAVVGLACAYPVYRRLSTRVHSIEQRVDDLSTEKEAHKYASVIRDAVRSFSSKQAHPTVKLVRRRAGEG